MHQLTLNQIMVLLDIRRGTFRKARHLVGVDEDAAQLNVWHLTTMGAGEFLWELTARGQALAEHIENEAVFADTIVVGTQHE